MPRRLTRPRSNAERGRAGRLRRAPDIGKRDASWLARYDRDVAAHKTARAEGLRLPKGPRARTNSERGRASELRTKARTAQLTKREQRTLERYDRAVRESQQVRDVRRARKRRRSVRADAKALTEALANWMGEAGESGPSKHVRKTKWIAWVTEVDWQGERGAAGVPVFPPNLAPHLSGGHAMGARVELGQPRGASEWATVLAYTNDALVAAVDIWKELMVVLDAYKAFRVLTISVIVGPE